MPLTHSRSSYSLPVIPLSPPLPPLYSHLILQVVLALGDYMNVQCHACIGGQSIGEDIRKLDYGQVGEGGRGVWGFGKEWEC